jgi:hypothetical protein
MNPELEEQLDGMLLADGFDDCILGIAERCGSTNVVAYDAEAIINSLVEQGMTYEEASEYFSFNISGAYVGEQTPVFIHHLCQNQKHQHGAEKKAKTRKAVSTQKAERATTKLPAATSSRQRPNPKRKKTPRAGSRSVRGCRA